MFAEVFQNLYGLLKSLIFYVFGYIELECDGCNKVYVLSYKEYHQQIDNHHYVYCSKDCKNFLDYKVVNWL